MPQSEFRMYYRQSGDYQPVTTGVLTIQPEHSGRSRGLQAPEDGRLNDGL